MRIFVPSTATRRAYERALAHLREWTHVGTSRRDPSFRLCQVVLVRIGPAVREVTPFFVKMLLRCRATVFSLRNSVAAIWGFAAPSGDSQHLDLPRPQPVGQAGPQEPLDYAPTGCAHSAANFALQARRYVEN
jgi:hypothetical protein